MVGMVKNIEHLKLTPSSLKKATNIFKGESPNPSPTSEGSSCYMTLLNARHAKAQKFKRTKPCSKAVPRVAS